MYPFFPAKGKEGKKRRLPSIFLAEKERRGKTPPTARTKVRRRCLTVLWPDRIKKEKGKEALGECIRGGPQKKGRTRGGRPHCVRSKKGQEASGAISTTKKKEGGAPSLALTGKKKVPACPREELAPRPLT